MPRRTRARASRAGLGLLLLLSACGPGEGGGGACDELLPGDLVIAEILGNPEGDDTGQEWIEIYNARAEPVELSGVSLASSRTDGTDEERHEIETGTMAPGAYFVLGDVLHDLRPGWVDYGYGSDLGSLRNEAGRLAVLCGDKIIDETGYDVMDSGIAHQLSGASPPDYQQNDELGNWCAATNEFSTGNFGTPGEANGSCGGGPLPTECDEGGSPRPVVLPALGDLVITEVMANPMAVSDAEGEWFEILATREVDLNGLALGISPGEPRTTMTQAECLRVAAGTYVVLARNANLAENGGLSDVRGTFSFGLTNSGGSLFIAIGDTLLDQVSWSSSGDGASSGVDPARATPTENDDPLNWCRATVPFGAGDRGSPGQVNEACAITPPDGMCQEAAGMRPIDPPAAGDLVLTEFMANPDAVADDEGEWFELLVARDLDLNGLEIGTLPPTVRQTLTSLECLRVTAGTRVLMARNDEMTANGGLPPVSFVFGFDVVNSNSGLFVGLEGTVLDAITWTSTTTGASKSLDPDATDPTGNDTAANFCNGTSPYGGGDLGTPAAENPQCP